VDAVPDSPFKLPPGDWARLRVLLDEGLALPAATRERWLAALAPADEPLSTHLRRLLTQADEGPAALDAGPRAETADFAAPPPVPMPAQVGPYRLLHELGSGGMASVWLAERTDLLQARQVALKLPHGAWRRAGLAERLAREREILATLEHPNIARLYDAGLADDGQPYLALELVRGEPIDAWCERQALGVPARVALFGQVARAVAYAHARLVVHRDLKPANILVTAEGQVKLLDFGIAKLLDAGPAEATELTQQLGRALTLRYAAPEQLLGQPVGTAADVYALGVLLYELLSGQRPYRPARDSAAALEDAVLHEQPPPPSRDAPAARRAALRGDLDTIVLKALKKDPAARYATVDALAEDLQRHLEHRPVLARPDGAGYRLAKWARRHRLAAATGAAVLLALAGGGGLAFWQAGVARDEQRRAEAEAERARKALRVANANVTLADFLASDLSAQRSTTELSAQLNRAAAMVRQQYASQPLERAHLMADLAGRQRRSGDFDTFRALATEAEAALREAGDVELGARLSCVRAVDLAQSGDVAGARQLMARALPVLEAPGREPDAALTQCLTDASSIARTAGDGAEAVRTAERIREIERAAGITGSATYGTTLMILGRAYALNGRFSDALRVLDEAREIHARAGSGSTAAALNVRVIRATVLRDGGQPAAALAEFDAVLAAHAASGGDPRSLASVQYDRGVALQMLGRLAEATRAHQQALPAARQLGDRSLVRAASVALAVAQARAGQAADAQASLSEAMALYAQPLAQQSFNARLPLFAQAELALATGQAALAQDGLDRAAAVLARRGGTQEDAATRTLLVLRARMAQAQGQPAAARALAQQALALARKQAIDPETSVHVDEVQRLLAPASP
jgi:eukaryotic-like serine/threonine-protein kinase